MPTAKSTAKAKQKSGQGKRHLIGAVKALRVEGGITTKQDLMDHLVVAAQIELSTIPLYLYPMYSMKSQSQYAYQPGESAYPTMRGIVIEEMLHLTLARNMLIAIGGGDQLRFYDEAFIPKYPSLMLHRKPDLVLQLRECTLEAVTDIYMPLELPQQPDAPPQAGTYNTLGQLYAAVKLGFETLAGPQLFDSSKFQYELNTGYYNEDGGGSPFCVTNLVGALQSIDTIVAQGEGAFPGADYYTEAGQLVTEFSHYEKFSLIAQNVNQIGTDPVNGASNTWPVKTDPCLADFPHGPIRDLAEFFDACYSYLLILLDNIFTSSNEDMNPTTRKSKKKGLVEGLLTTMSGILYPVAALLVQQPLPDSVPQANAGPTFEFYKFGSNSDPKEQLLTLCHDLQRHYPSLGGDNSVYRTISLMPSVKPVSAATA
jgi:hypothetical protein